VWLLISQEARLDIDATDGVLREVDRSEGLDVDIGYTADERVKEFPGRHQTSVGNSTCKIPQLLLFKTFNTEHSFLKLTELNEFNVGLNRFINLVFNCV